MSFQSFESLLNFLTLFKTQNPNLVPFLVSTLIPATNLNATFAGKSLNTLPPSILS